MTFVGSTAELLTGPDHRGVALIGPQGSRLAAEIADRVRHLGHPVVRCGATAATSDIPFGAFAALLPAELSGPNPLGQVADHLADRGRKVVLVVDDAHLLDTASAALVRYVIRRGDLKVLLTTPTDWPDFGLLRLPTGAEPTAVDLAEANLGDRHRSALELLAFSEPVELYLLVALTSAEVVDELDAMGLLRVTATGKRVHVRLSHQQHSGYLRAACPPSRSRAHQQALAEGLEDIGVWRREDTLRVAGWRLASGTPAPLDLLVRAAGHAWRAQDWGLTERLCRAAIDQGGLKDVGVLLGTVLTYRRASDEADEVLAAVADAPGLRAARAYTRVVGLARLEPGDDVPPQDPDDARCASLIAVGELDEAHALATKRLGEVIAGEVSCPTKAIWRIHLATCARLRGRAQDAVRAVREATAANYGLPLMPDAAMLAELAMGLALRGRPEQAAYALARAEAASRPAWLPVGVTVAAARAWVLATAGRMADAAQAAEDVAAMAREHGLAGHEVFALHDAARFGADTSDRLNELAWSLGGPLTKACAAYARGRAAGDPMGLAAVAVEFTRMGVILYAVDALAEAVRLARAAGQLREAAMFGRRLAVLLDRCDNVTTPALRIGGLSGLTPRQLEVARLAMSGLTNQQIADQLRTSKRTVDNHLYATYTALGVRGRTELTGVMGPG